MAQAISNRNVLSAKFELADFTGDWLRHLGRPALHVSEEEYRELQSGSRRELYRPVDRYYRNRLQPHGRYRYTRLARLTTSHNHPAVYYEVREITRAVSPQGGKPAYCIRLGHPVMIARSLALDRPNQGRLKGAFGGV